jgi:hypothetical protein
MTVLFSETTIGPLTKAGWDDAIASNRELADEVEAAYSSEWPEPGCTPEQQQAARDVMDWFAKRPGLCAVVAVGVVAMTVLFT